MRCVACHRKLLHPVDTPLGPMGIICAGKQGYGSMKKKREKASLAVRREQRDLFEIALDVPETSATLQTP